MGSDEVGKAQRLDMPWGTLDWLASAEIGNAEGVTVGRVVIDVGSANPRHVHDNCEEVVYVLDGHLEHSVGDRVVELRTGDVIVVGPGISHHARNLGDRPADLVVAYSSGVRGFRAVDGEAGATP